MQPLIGGIGYRDVLVGGEKVTVPSWPREIDAAKPVDVVHLVPIRNVDEEQAGWGKPLAQNCEDC